MSPDVWALSSCFTVNSRSLCLSNCEDTATRSYQRAPFIHVCSVKNTFTLQTLQTELMSRGVNASAGSPAFSEHSSVFLNSDSTPTFFLVQGALQDMKSSIMWPAKEQQNDVPLKTRSVLPVRVGIMFFFFCSSLNLLLIAGLWGQRTSRAALPFCPFIFVFVCVGYTTFPAALCVCLFGYLLMYVCTTVLKNLCSFGFASAQFQA